MSDFVHGEMVHISQVKLKSGFPTEKEVFFQLWHWRRTPTRMEAVWREFQSCFQSHTHIHIHSLTVNITKANTIMIAKKCNFQQDHQRHHYQDHHCWEDHRQIKDHFRDAPTSGSRWGLLGLHGSLWLLHGQCHRRWCHVQVSSIIIVLIIKGQCQNGHES